MSNAQSSLPADASRSPTSSSTARAGHWVSDLFPHTGKIVDDLCFVQTHAHAAREPRPGRLLPAHRLPALGPSGRGRLGQLRARHRQRQPAELRGDEARSTRPPASAPTRALGPRASCRPTTRASSSARAPTPVLYVDNPDGIDRDASAASSSTSSASCRAATTSLPAIPRSCPRSPSTRWPTGCRTRCRKCPTSPTSRTTSSTCTARRSASRAPSPATAC